MMSVKTSKSNPNLVSVSKYKLRVSGKAPIKINSLKFINEKGDAETLCTGNDELKSGIPQLEESDARRQKSAPSLTNVIPKPLNGITKTPKRSSTPKPESALGNAPTPVTTNIVFLAKNSLSSDSAAPATTPAPPICRALQKDSRLKALVLSLGINPSASTLVGPIEKGQLIIGTLQESLQELIKLKTKKAAKRGKIFHIQSTGLDLALRALKNAERSLKTIKQSKQPVLGRARTQMSSESLILQHKKSTEAVIRILSSTKQKFDRMGNGMDKLLGGISLVSSLSPTPSSTPYSYYSRRPTGTSGLTTPVTPSYCTTTTTAGSRAKTSTSAGSIGGRAVGHHHGKLLPFAFIM